MLEQQKDVKPTKNLLTRRNFIKFSAIIGLSVGTNGLLASCGGDSDIPKKSDQPEQKEIAKQMLDEYLKSINDNFNNSLELQKELEGTQGWINTTIGFRTENNDIQQALIISDGKLDTMDQIPEKVDATFVFATEQDIIKSFEASPDELSLMQLSSRVRAEGNLALYSYFGYLVSILYGQEAIKAAEEQAEKHKIEALELAKDAGTEGRNVHQKRMASRLKAESIDPGVHWLSEPYLFKYTLEDFPRLEKFLSDRRNTKPEVTCEQPKLLTDYYIKHGFDTKKDGTQWEPHLRNANGFYYVMSKKIPLIRENDLLAGTYTPNPICGTITQPNTVGWSIWSELRTIHGRELDPYTITEETIETLHKYVFPFWVNRNIHQMWIDKFNNPLVAQINDRLFCLNLWSLISLNPGCPGLDKVVKKGIIGIKKEIQEELENDNFADKEKIDTLEAMKISLDAVLIYVKNLAEETKKEAETARNDLDDQMRAEELENLYGILLRVPENPAETLHEAIQTLWIMHIALGLESMDDDLALGRLDQILQPYFEADIEKKQNDSEREDYIKQAIELVGCLFMRITSHTIAAPTIASWQNSGAPPTASTVVGGVNANGEDAVNDMTYIILKLTEMLSLNDPDMDARYMPGINSDTYLKRVCEVNYLTWGTPAIHNDAAVIESWSQFNDYEIEDIREWVPCGCVEPVISGKHFGATGDVDSNLMAPFAMALNNGYHPVAMWDLGPKTGNIEDFTSFESFYSAFQEQFEFLYTHAIMGSHQLLEINQLLIPSPLYSTLLEGCIQKGRGMTRGGAKYNSSGASLIALSDVIDSMMVIKKIVFEKKEISFQELKEAMDNNFNGYEKIHELVKSIPKFGSGNKETVDMANRITKMIADYLHSKDNGRGGHYSTGYRTNNNHTVYGRVSGASPSGRLEKEPFTPGCTPSPQASDNILDNLLDMASLDPTAIDNSISFNVRFSFLSDDAHQENIENLADLAKTYCEQGGMQIQFIMADSNILKDAMANPQYYPGLICRVSGYTGYYIQMQRDLQLEILGRCEYKV
ncbi:Formate acetyltransferase [Candidatus Magnetomoraceae bacterium gMMP-15]